MSGAEGEQGRPGRYQRSISGGIGALLVLLVVVLAFVGFRALTRDNPDGDTEAVDYLAAVGPAQEAGMRVVYPPRLPAGWTATSVEFADGERPAWGIGVLTDEGRFVGIRQRDTDLESLLATYVDEEPVSGGTVSVPGALVTEWHQWSDSGGDQAMSADVAGTRVLVYGSAPVEDLMTMVGLLTDAPLEGPTSSG